MEIKSDVSWRRGTWGTTPFRPTLPAARGMVAMQDVRRSAHALRMNADSKAASKQVKKNEDAEEWHCDICSAAQSGPAPEESVGKRYCSKCRKQWEAGWELARAQLSEGPCTREGPDGELQGLCRKCRLPLGEFVYCDDAGEATLHEECMAQLKLLEVQGKEQARERDVAAKKKAVREKHGIGWSITMVPCAWGLAEKLGCKLPAKQGLCCLVLEGQRVRVVETALPSAAVNLEYLALALQVRLHEGREPLFSLDPVHHEGQEDNSENSTQIKHFEPDWLMGTAVGEVMFQADYHLKELSMGEYEQPVVGMRSMSDLSEEERAGQGWNAREWFTVRGAEVYKSADNVLMPHVEMSVEAREQVQGPRGWEDARCTREDHPLVRYARDFTRNFDLIAERRSVVYHLRELARASVLAKFLLDSEVQLDDPWFNTVNWSSVKTAATGCSLEIPQLWNDRYRSRIRLHSGAALGQPDGVVATTQSVYGGVSFGLDRFRLEGGLRPAATLTARLSAPAAGLMAQTLVDTSRSTRHPRGVDLNLDKFSLSEALDLEVEQRPRPVVGSSFWPCLENGKLEDSALLKEVFNPLLSDRRGEGELFVPPEASKEYLQKLRELVEQEAKVQQERTEKFFSADFVMGEPGALFPASWKSSISIGEEHSDQALRPYSGKALQLADLKRMTLIFDQSAEDGLRFRIYRLGGVEVRSTQKHGEDEVIGATFSTKGNATAQGSLADSEPVVRITLYVSGAEEPQYWLLLEVEGGRTIATELLGSGLVAWDEDPDDLATRGASSKAMGSLSCASAGLTVGCLRPAPGQQRVQASAADCKRYAEDAYCRAWAFSSARWRPTCVAEGTRMQTLRCAAAKAQSDRTAVLAAVGADGLGLERAAEPLRADRGIVAAAVAENGAALRFASSPLRADRDVVRLAVAQDGLAVGHASSSLRSDAEIAALAVRGNSYALELLGEEARGRAGVVLASLQRNEFALGQASQQLREDRAFNLAAVRRNGRALEDVPLKWRADREFMLEVVRNNGFALKYASAELRADAKVVLAALEQDARAVEYADIRGLGLASGDDVVEELRERLRMELQ